MLDEAIQFMTEFIEADNQHYVLAHSERDDDIVTAAFRKIRDRFFDENVYYVQDYRRNGNWAKLEKRGRRVVPRSLYRADLYDEPTYGKIVVVTLGPPILDTFGAHMYYNQFHVGRKNGELKILSMWAPCVVCHCVGTLKGASCPECKGKGWIHSGLEVGSGPAFELGNPLETRKFEAPTDPLYQEVHALP